ncbi:MAG: TPM domain-containing protein [Deltaproteobacteria bacterium]|nr:TPM domain-containing protein [Deltaproteobacteria bacterium]MBW2389896.1 TPM domain-containing protein [Deltaproteobacteria bacterium]
MPFARARVGASTILVLCTLGVTIAALTPELAVAEFSIPALKSPVVDRAGLLSNASKARLERALQALKRDGGTQLAVLTVPSLEGLTIEQASIRVTDQWQLGSASEDNGVLLMIAKDERRIRIEVGQGLEGVLTDAHAKRIIDESITPLFRTGDVDAGVTIGVFEIARRTNPEIDLRAHLEGSLRPASRSSRRTRSSPLSTLLFLLIAIPVALMRMGMFGGTGHYRRRGGYYWGGGGFGGGGGFSGGGFSGGGGGFSGGGASGGW